jgi:serine O-acetyltransferase
VSSERELKVLQGLRVRLASKREVSPADDAVLQDMAYRLAMRRPPFFHAVTKDAMTYAFHRAEFDRVRSRIGRWRYIVLLPFRTSEFLALELYRLRTLLRSWHIPLLPTLLNWTCAIGWNVRIADSVIVDAGVYLSHGQVEIEGLTYIGKRCYLAPFTGIGLVQGDMRGPYLEDGVFVGTGARILGPVRIGRDAKVGANAAVLRDVPPRASAIGVPARIVRLQDPPSSNGPGGEIP